MKAKQLRAVARKALKGKYWWAALASLIALVFGVYSIGSAASGASNSASTSGNTAANINLPGVTAEMTNATSTAMTIIAIAGTILSIAIAIVGCAVSIGYSKYNLELYKQEKAPSIGILFSYMKIVWKSFWLKILKFLKVFVWSLLFVIPGIIAGYRYSMAEFVMAENPDMSAGDAVKRSCEIMKGNKWKLFCLDFSFIGWDILAGFFPLVGPLFLKPYIEASHAAFYLDKSGRKEELA